MKHTADTIRALKARGERVPCLTAYDYPTARLLDEAGVPLLLVGDSLGMVVLGLPDTTGVTMADMKHHVRAVARAKPSGLLVADLPAHSYDTVEAAVTNARRLVAAGAEAVKAEGGQAIVPQVRAIVAAGIPFLGHLGMLPQHVHETGGYKIQGRAEAERLALHRDADVLVAAGAFGIVLELVTSTVARELTQRLPVPTIGIGSGKDCDGQILVTPDLVGLFPWFTPRHVKPKAQAGAEIRAAVTAWLAEVRGNRGA